MAANSINLAELVAKLPTTDRDLEAQKPPPPVPEGQPAPKPKTIKLGEASKVTGPDPGPADAMCLEVLKAGPPAVFDLLGMISDPGSPDFKDYKAEYLAHNLVMFAGRPGNEVHRTMLAPVLSKALADGKFSPHTRIFLVRELQLLGGPEAIDALAPLLTNEELCVAAATAMTAIRAGATAAFLRALPKAQGGCKLSIVQNLAVLGEATALAALRQALNDDQADVRLAAAWGLARLADESSSAPLLKLADTEAPYERIKATQACLLLAEKLVAASKRAEAIRIYNRLRETRTDPKEAYVRDLATQALIALNAKPAV